MLEKNKTVTKFLNRMLAMSLRDQKLLFTYFTETMVSLLAHVHDKLKLTRSGGALLRYVCHSGLLQSVTHLSSISSQVVAGCGQRHVQAASSTVAFAMMPMT